MKTRVNVTICDMEYALIAEGSEEYIRKTAAYVEKKIREVQDSSGRSIANAAVLAGLNLADEKFNCERMAENLREQIKDIFEENSKLKDEIAELKRELTKVKQGQTKTEKAEKSTKSSDK